MIFIVSKKTHSAFFDPLINSKVSWDVKDTWKITANFKLQILNSCNHAIPTEEKKIVKALLKMLCH